jgi:hypothetical protein
MNSTELEAVEVLDRTDIYNNFPVSTEELPLVKVKYTLIEE